MVSNQLKKAQEYEIKEEQKVTEPERPAFHLTPRIGWMNDPNGFSFYNGKYHMFYQYHPYDTQWGPMHWGHAVSTDLMHWEYLPAALAPDQPYDDFGCFSGGAVALKDGRHLLMYTGVTREKGEDGIEHDVQTQCIAVGDGIHYEKYEGNPVLTEADLPEGASRMDFRDPKVWMTEEGTFECVIASRDAEGSGQILLYTSADGFDWKFDQILAANHGRFGRMWECPDFFELDGKGVILTSPQDMLVEDFEYISGNGTLCLTGAYDEAGREFHPEHSQAIDYGIDFYATQTILTEDGRRIMMAWMQNWDACGNRMDDQKWFGQITIPREISIRDGRLIQIPSAEVDALRENPIIQENICVSEVMTVDGVSGRCVDLELEIQPADQETLFDDFEIRFAGDGKQYTSLTYCPTESTVTVDRRLSGTRRALAHQRTCKVADCGGKLKLRMVLDRYSAEIFVNDGEQAISIVFYTELSADQISFSAGGKAVLNLVKYDLR